jgi:hypothetical protein
MEKTYVKGFILDLKKVAELAGVEDTNDSEVDAYLDVIIHGFNRDGYKFIGVVYHPSLQESNGKQKLALAIVLEIGHDEEVLRKMELQPIDETIAAAQPHVLVGPDVWELWG